MPEEQMSVTHARSRLALEVKKQRRQDGAQESASVVEARQHLAEEKIREFVERAVAQALPLTADQRGRLASLFRGSEAPTTSEQGRMGTSKPRAGMAYSPWSEGTDQDLAAK